MRAQGRALTVFLSCLACLAASSAGAGEDKPSPLLTASPMVSISPAKIAFKVQLKGGADDDEEFYCPEVHWDWDDGARSEWKQDCTPYEKGKSRITRIFTAQHEYKHPGEYRVEFRLKRGNQTLTSANITVTVS